MSIALMTAAWALDISPTDKLVLLALADWANESDGGRCWPSIKKLCERSSLCERAVQSALKRLVAAGHLTRVENPGKGVNYFVHPAVGSGMRGVDLPEYHYVYRTENPETGQFYIGARSSLDPIEDDKYMGSGVWVKASIAAGARLVKSILEQYPSREALAHGEVAHAAMVIANPLCMNAKMPSAGNLTKKFNGDTPALDAPRTSCAPHQMYLTPALDAPNTLGTVSKDKKATPPYPSAKAKPAFVLPDWIPADAWADFLVMRKAKRAGPTEKAKHLLVAKLSKLAGDGHAAGDVLNQSTENYWTGLFPLKETNNGQRNLFVGGNDRKVSVASIVRDLVAEARAVEAESPVESVGDYRGTWAALPGRKLQ